MSVHSREPNEILCRWHHLFPGLNLTPKDFYEELQRRISEHAFPEVRIGTVEFSERGLMSAKRLYLRVVRGDLVFDICGSPFGTKVFFVSYWLGRTQLSGCTGLFLAMLTMIPLIGVVIERAFRPMTYYERDSALMFEEAIHGILIAYVDELAGTQGIVPLSEGERTPFMKRLTEI